MCWIWLYTAAFEGLNPEITYGALLKQLYPKVTHFLPWFWCFLHDFYMILTIINTRPRNHSKIYIESTKNHAKIDFLQFQPQSHPNPLEYQHPFENDFLLWLRCSLYDFISIFHRFRGMTHISRNMHIQRINITFVHDANDCSDDNVKHCSYNRIFIHLETPYYLWNN